LQLDHESLENVVLCLQRGSDRFGTIPGKIGDVPYRVLGNGQLAGQADQGIDARSINSQCAWSAVCVLRRGCCDSLRRRRLRRYESCGQSIM
jgi:hypothetical protein